MSAIGLHRSDRSSTSESGAGENVGGRLSRSPASRASACAILSITFRLAVGGITPGTPTRSPPCTSTSASASVTTSARSSLDLLRKLRSKRHRRRTVGPDPNRVRGFPFLLAHIEVLVARRAAPIDARGRFARHKPAILPEILARAGAPAAMQAVNDGRRHPPRLQHEPRHGVGEGAAAPAARPSAAVSCCRVGEGAMRSIRAAP